MPYKKLAELHRKMKKSSELKLIAKEGLKGKYGKAIGAMFLYILMAMVPLCSPAMQVGYNKFNLKLVRKENAGAGDVIDGFKVFGKAFWLNIITAFFLYLWMILFIIPGLIKAFSYSMAMYILADNPQMTAREALRSSKELMHGKKGKLFYIYLSFIGWILLGYITLGIAFIWILPYVQATIAAFYNEAIADRQ
jgi:uncharacterized membrane protein